MPGAPLSLTIWFVPEIADAKAGIDDILPFAALRLSPLRHPYFECRLRSISHDETANQNTAANRMAITNHGVSRAVAT